ncbi:WapI family immunity protein [Priestia aryabhattai]|uniref:WapI family immunity protein n=1 Tax=Priestia aryabhattai TaxID=412384 RepID=UPI001CCE3CE3|nr:hypothetical protein [Priestia aryabhattai]MBZ6487709.1 hypothetical protein [Priestia aryabhattai]
MEQNYFSNYPFAELSAQDGLSCLKICTYAYAYPEADNIHDADWHKNYLTFNIPAFKAEIDEVILEGRTIKYYLNELKKFSALKQKKVLFEPTEPYFGFTLTMNGRKNVSVDGFIQYPAGWGTELKFEFETDLTYIDAFIQGLESILIQYPVKEI